MKRHFSILINKRVINEMWMLLTLFVAILLISYFYKRNRFDYWNKQGVPTASGCHWFFGHYKNVILQTQHLRDLAQEIYDEFPEAPVVGYFKLHIPGLLIRDPDVMKTVLIPEFSNFGSNGFFKDRKYDVLAGTNPFFANQEDWRVLRSHSAAALTHARLKGYFPRMRTVGEEMQRYVAARAGAALDVRDLASRFATDVLGAAVCGVASASFAGRALFGRVTGEVSFDTSVCKNLKDALQSAWPALNRIFRVRFTSPKCEETLLYVIRRVIQERMASGQKTDDFFQIAMTMRENDKKGVFTDEYISGLVYAIMLNQYETSSQVIIHTLLALAWHPDIQDKLRKEIIDHNPKSNEAYTIEDIENLKYLDMVLSESLRMFSAVPVLSRVCTNDCAIPVPGLPKPINVTKGTYIIMATQSMHMDPKYYPAPGKFDPERFSEEEAAERPKYTYLPFGEGPKRCPGSRLATLQIKVAVASLVQHFRLRPAPGSQFPPNIIPGVFLTTCPAPPTDIVFEAIENYM